MAPSGSNNEKKDILVAEDDDTCFYYLSEVLQNSNTNIIRKSNGVDVFVECIKNPCIYAVLMDIKMPGINGFEATRLIKKYRPDIQIIAQTAYVTLEDRAKCYKAGCDEYLSKPIMPETLLNTMCKILEKTTNNSIPI